MNHVQPLIALNIIGVVTLITSVQIQLTTVFKEVALLLQISERYSQTTGPGPNSKPKINAIVITYIAGSLSINSWKIHIPNIPIIQNA